MLPGTLPGRKPGSFAFFLNSLTTRSVSAATAGAGTSILSCLRHGPTSSTERTTLIDNLGGREKKDLAGVVRKGGLEPPPLSGLDPKSSASTSSATFARAAERQSTRSRERRTERSV